MTLLLLSILTACSSLFLDVPDFKRPNTAGEIISLHKMGDDATALVLISHGVDCPVIQQYSPIIKEMAASFAPKGVRFAFVNANTQDDAQEVAADLKEYDAGIPVFLDENQKMSMALAYKTTSETIVIDPKTWTIKYRGAIDDQIRYAGRLGKPRHHYLKDALGDVLAGVPVKTPSSRAYGCAISYLD
jgi:thiol-disulfide isomerase/thioredoxin